MKRSITEAWNNLTPLGRLLFGFVSLLLFSCIAFSCFATVLVIFFPTPTPVAQTEAAFTASPSFTISPSPSVFPNFTPLPGPSLTSLPTRSAYASSTPPIYLITPTNTFLPFSADPSSTMTPTRYPHNKAVCACSYDKYDCTDFKKQIQAQACFNFCFSQGAGDVHHLDDDNHDGLACNSLP